MKRQHCAIPSPALPLWSAAGCTEDDVSLSDSALLPGNAIYSTSEVCIPISIPPLRSLSDWYLRMKDRQWRRYWRTIRKHGGLPK
jgi:hypothetical protein